MSKRVGHDFTPNPELMALWPEVSGNDINGRGETERRRPRPVYWQRPHRIAHHKVQEWSVRKFGDEPTLLKVYGGDRGPKERTDTPETRAEDSAENWTARVNEFALQNSADFAGITKLDPEWIYEGYEVPTEPWVIVLGAVMDYGKLSTAPELPAAEEVMVQYNRAAKACRLLANWIIGQGYSAKTYEGPYASALSMLPAALAAGFGELGKHGSIINRNVGSSFRLSAIGTDMPLVPTLRDEFGADEFCQNCQVCANACPPQAISHEKQWVRGVKRWYVDFDKCLPYFSETYGCGICIAVCPWSRPGVADNLVAKMARRRASQD